MGPAQNQAVQPHFFVVQSQSRARQLLVFQETVQNQEDPLRPACLQSDQENKLNSTLITRNLNNHFMNQEIEELLLKADLGINNALSHPQVAGLLNNFGYTPEKLSTGKELLDQAQDLHQQQAKEYGEQLAASNELQLKRSTAHHTYINYLTIARIAFKDEPGMWTRLQLQGKRKRTYAGWIGQTKLFYTNLLADEAALSQMAAFGQTAENLQEGLALVEGVEQQMAVQKRETGESQEATKSRDQAVDFLQDWYSDFIAIARIALQSKPQFLEMLGIVSPS